MGAWCKAEGKAGLASILLLTGSCCHGSLRQSLTRALVALEDPDDGRDGIFRYLRETRVSA
jgi:hypothetical protein